MLRQFGTAVAADATLEAAEALVRVAAGESPEDVAPEPGEIAFDLALDALSSVVPGGSAATHALGLAAKSGKRAARSASLTKTLIDDNRGILRAQRSIRMGRTECAIVMENLNTYYHTRLKGKAECTFPIGNYAYRVVPHNFANYEIIGRREIP